MDIWVSAFPHVRWFFTSEQLSCGPEVYGHECFKDHQAPLYFEQPFVKTSRHIFSLLSNCIIIFACIGCLPSIVFSQSSSNALDSAVHDPNFKALRQYIREHLIYPVSARRTGKEALVYVKFNLDDAGFIMPDSVTAMPTDCPSCEVEAIRVVKSYHRKWEQSGIETRNGLIVPVNFKLKGHPGPLIHTWKGNPVYGVMKPRPDASGKIEWPVYSDPNLSYVVRKIAPGTSVRVLGWTARSFLIESQKQKGYVSTRAVSGGDGLATLQRVMRESREPNAFLSLRSNKDTLTEGECATLTMAFNVSLENKAAIQFYDPGTQLFQFMTSGLTVDHCLQVDSHISNIEGKDISIDGEYVTSYEIYRAAYCPVKAEDIHFPEFNLGMQVLYRKPGNRTDTLGFKSAPLTIKVNSLPTGANVSASGDFKMVGDFKLQERVVSENPMAGTIVFYEIMLSGEGPLLPLEPLPLKVEGASVEVWDVKDGQQLVADKVESRKIITYGLIFQKEGIYSLRDKFVLRFYNPVTKKIATLSTSTVLSIGKGSVAPPVLFPRKDKFIAIDVSRSMELEHDGLTRLQVVKNGLETFLTKRSACDVGILVFEGKPRKLFQPGRDSCQVKTLVSDIKSSNEAPGTAIGDAIWLAQNSFTGDSVRQKLLVLIGDGDGNEGMLRPQWAAELARRDNVKIFTIGIGKEGLLQFGKDANGKPVQVDNTFLERDLKEISDITGGKYYRARDAQHIASILAEIFK